LVRVYYNLEPQRGKLTSQPKFVDLGWEHDQKHSERKATPNAQIQMFLFQMLGSDEILRSFFFERFILTPRRKPEETFPIFYISFVENRYQVRVSEKKS
jgi:hypothetical protein